MRIALVHDYFTQLGGAERVAEALYKMLPGATVFTTVANETGMPESMRGADIHTSWMQRLPAIDRFYRHYFPLYPLGVGSLDLRGYDLVVSSSSGYAKGVRVDRNAVHISYCHTPMRWVWRYNDYASREQFGLAHKLLLPVFVRGLKQWDLDASRQPDQYIVNSTVVAERVWDAYGRRATVIPPPIDVDRFQLSPEQDDYYLVLSRLVGYKRIDLAVEACAKMNRRLIVIGDGPDRTRLQRVAGPTVEFLGRVPDAIVSRYVSRCRALIFPGEEDFGIVPLEVNSAGRPVIAYKAGGALDTVVDGVTGLYFTQPAPASLAEAIERFESSNWKPAIIRLHAERFDLQVFHERVFKLISAFVPNLESHLPNAVLPETASSRATRHDSAVAVV